MITQLLPILTLGHKSLAREHVLLQTWRQMAVMPFNHADAGAHLYGQRMYIHAVVEQRKGRIGVAQAVERAVLTRSWACD